MAGKGERLVTMAHRIHKARAAVNEASAIQGYNSITANNARVQLEELIHTGRAMLDPLHRLNRHTSTTTSKEYAS